MNTLSMFKNETTIDEFAAGQTIFREGEPGDKMYVVQEGQVEIQVGGTAVDLARQGDLLGEMALVDNSARSATAVARTDCRLIPVDEKRFMFLVQQTPFFSIHVMRILAGRLRRMNAAASGEPGRA